MVQGQIIKSTGGQYTVVDAQGQKWSTKPRGLFRKTGQVPYVGDFVEVDPSPTPLTGTIVAIKERKNCLVRPPVANLDFMVAVVSTTDPEPNLVTLDKFLAIMDGDGVPTVLAITKPDKGDSHPLEALYTQVGYSVVTVNNITGEGTKELSALLGSSLAAFSGNSGTGKSSLLNAMDPSLDLPVGETSKKLGRGRHTTRHVEIFSLPSGLRVADTPGFSALDMVQAASITAEDLGFHFIDFINHIPHCHFRDCSHTSEIKCGVKQAVAEKIIPQSRYTSYVQIYEELKDVKEWERR